MAQSGAVGLGQPWVGYVGASAPPPPRVLPRPVPPPRPTRGSSGDAGGTTPSVATEKVAPEAPPQGGGGVKGWECPTPAPPWDSPSSTASSAYFSYSSTSSPPPSAGSPTTHCFLPTDGRRIDQDPRTARNNASVAAEQKKPTPAPRGAVKSDLRQEDAIPEGTGEISPPTPGGHSGWEERGDSAKIFRRPSEETETSVIRRRATVEVRSVAVQTPSGLMAAFDSRATYPRAKGHHWRVGNQDGEPSLPRLKKTSMPTCEWHCSFVGGDESTSAKGKEQSTITADEGVGSRCDRRSSAPSVDRSGGRGEGEDVAAAPVDSLPSGEDVGRDSKEAAAHSRDATVAKAPTTHQRMSSRAEICPAPQLAYSDTKNVSSAENNRVIKSSSQTSINNQPPTNSQPSIDDPPPPNSQPTYNNQPPVDSKPPVNCQALVSSQHASQSIPPKPATPPTPSRRHPSPHQSPKPTPREVEPPSPAVKHHSKCQPPPPARLQSTPIDHRHQGPLTHWLSELRSSKDAVEDEEGGVSMEDKGGSESRPVQEEEVELRGGPSRGPCERALNRSRKDSGGEISIYEDACSCLNGDWCCGAEPSSPGDTTRGQEPSKGGGGYKGIWGIDGAALDGGESVTVRGGSRTRGEGIEWRLSALGLKDKTGGMERNKEEGERVPPSTYCRRTISEGMLLMRKGKRWRELEAKEIDETLKKGAAMDPKTNGAPRNTNVFSTKECSKTSKIERDEEDNVGSPIAPSHKSPVNEKPPSGSPNSVSSQPTTRRDGHAMRSLPEDEDDWPRRSKFTEDDMPCDDGDGLIILPETPEGHRSRISQSDSFRSTTSSESKLSSAFSSSQEVPTTGGLVNNYSSSSGGNNSAKSSSCDNVSLSSSGGEASLQQQPPNLIAPRKKPPRKNLKPRSDDGESGGEVATKSAPQAARERGPSGEVAPERKATVAREECRTPGVPSKASPEDGKSPPKTTTTVSRWDESVGVPPSTVRGDMPCLGDVASGKPSAVEGVILWEAGKGRKVACPVAPNSPRLGKAGSVAASSSGKGGGCGSELSLDSPKCDEEEEDEEEEEDFGESEGCDWKGVYVSGRRKGSYSSDIEAWKRGLSGWCSVEDEDEFLESTMFDPEDSSMSVGCGSPERSAEEWYSSNDMEGRVYFFEENSNESSWTLPEVSVVSPPQTPPPAGVSGSPAGSDSFISGRSSGGEEGANGPRDVVESGGLVGVSRDDMTAMPLVKMKMNQWEKGGRLIQLRDSTLDKELRSGRSSRVAKTRSMVIGDPGLGEIKIPLPGKVPSSKDWPQLWDGNMYVLREGTLNKTKITENKKRVRKNWAPSHVVLTELFLLFFKDAKTFAALKAGTMGGSISPGDAGAMPELCVDLNGALVDREDQLSSRRNVFRVSTVLGLQVLCQDDNAQNAEGWFQDISQAALKLPSGFDGSPRLNTLELRNYTEPQSPDEHKKFPRIGRSKSVKVKKDASMEDLSAANVTERQVKIKARLKKFFHRRPTMEALVKKGIWKDEPAFGCYLEQVSGEGIPRIPLFVQRCIAAIESKPENMKADGLYRASGNLSQVQKIRLQVDQNNLSIVDMEEDVHVLTGALKLFFRELKEPLIPYSLFNKALTASTNSNRKEQLHAFKEIVNVLPVANYDTLKFLLQHLLRVTSYQEFNRMHVANLAIVFGPTLMWPKQESLNMALDLMQQNLVIECLLQEFDTIFSSGR